MQMFKDIFIQPEIERINLLKEQEKEFTNLVHNVLNDQYDKLLEVEFKKLNTQKKKEAPRPETAQLANITYAKRPFSAVSKNSYTYNE
jgi:DNA replication initiation complex subunit (GINS family)